MLSGEKRLRTEKQELAIIHLRMSVRLAFEHNSEMEKPLIVILSLLHNRMVADDNYIYGSKKIY